MKNALLIIFVFCAQFLFGQFENCQKILDKSTKSGLVHGTSFSISKGDSTWKGSTGNMDPDSRFFIASTTKLFTTTVIFQLVDEGKLQFTDSIAQFLSPEVMNGLHVYKGVDHSQKITIQHLLSHTSGLPDYFEGKNNEGKSLKVDLFQGNDQSWTFEECVEWSKNMKPLFAPGTAKKTHYSDTNYQLLGAIIERILSQKASEVFNARIIKKLGLTNTYLFQGKEDSALVQMNYKKDQLLIPQAMQCFGVDGGMVSNTTDLMMFLKAFAKGELFNKVNFEHGEFNKLFFPLESSRGFHRVLLPSYMNPGNLIPVLYGHSGLSGTVAFYNLEEDIFIAGTVNQLSKPSFSFRLMFKLVAAVQKQKKL